MQRLASRPRRAVPLEAEAEEVGRAAALEVKEGEKKDAQAVDRIRTVFPRMAPEEPEYGEP